jgi:tRNA-dihydrouridine synthase 4
MVSLHTVFFTPSDQAKEHASVPIIANGDICQYSDVARVAEVTGVDGVMSARGILANPALYAGYATAPLECVTDFVKLAIDYGTTHHEAL